MWLVAITTIIALATGLALTRSGRLPQLLLAAEFIAALFLITARLGVWSLYIWPVASAILFPFVRVPAAHPIATFDRVWVLASVSCLLLGHRAVARSSQSRLLTLTFAWMTVTLGVRALFTTGPDVGFGAITTWLDVAVVPFIVFLLARRLVFTHARSQQLAGSLAIAGTILAFIGIAEKALGFELASRTRGTIRFDPTINVVRISGPYPVPEEYALALIICLAATVFWVRMRRGNARIWGLLAVAVQCTAIALTFFRAAWIAALVVLLVTMSRPGERARTIVVSAFIAAVALLSFTQLQQNRAFSTRAHNTDNLRARLATYDQALEIFRHNPIYGVGVNQYYNVASKLPANDVGGVQSVPHPHDSYLGVLAEQGILGFLPFVAATLAVWYVLAGLRRRPLDEDDAALAAAGRGAAVGYFLMSLPLYMFPYGASTALLAVLLGALCGRLDALETDRTG